MQSQIRTIYPRLTAIVPLFLTIQLLWLSGCASKPQEISQEPPQWQAHKARVSAIENWQLRGKFAIISPDERVSANVAWQQAPVTYRLVITNFLGTTLAQLDGRPGYVKLALPDQGDWYDNEPEALLARMTGWQLPISLLHHWVRGLPGSNQAQEVTYTPDGYLASLLVPPQQPTPAASSTAPWRIRLSGYKQVKGIALPHNLELQQADTRIKFAVIQWDIPTPEQPQPELANAR